MADDCYTVNNNSDALNEKLDRAIRIMLDKAGVPVNLHGYAFLLTAIGTLYKIPRCETVELVGYLYPIVAKKYGVKISCVERSMRFAINAAWEENAQKVANLICVNRRPTSGEFIIKMAHRIRYLQ